MSFLPFSCIIKNFLDVVSIKPYWFPSLSPNPWPTFFQTFCERSLTSKIQYQDVQTPIMTPGKALKRLREKRCLIVSRLVILIFRTDKCQLRRIYINKNRSSKYKRIILITTLTKQINWRGKLLVNINENFSELFFTNTDELRTEQATRRANCNSFCHIQSSKNIWTFARRCL